MKPLLLTDLDDTLFQTARKMPPESEVPRIPAGLDTSGQPLSFMSPVQQAFIDWALNNMQVIAVTARGVDAYQRVQIPFKGPAVCTHGAVILDENGEPDARWRAHMNEVLAPHQEPMARHLDGLMSLGAALGFNLRGWLADAYEVNAYLVVKSNDSRDEDLATLIDAYLAQTAIDGFYVHRNGNNLALLPTPVNKKDAAQEILRRYEQQQGRVPVLGLGDSLSDFGFMSLCDWWGSPRTGQLAERMADLT